jgi:hypothetical protein
MRTVKLEKDVADVSGLFFELIQGGFELLSISSHQSCTYINLEDEEDKDPLVIAYAFLERPVKAPSNSVIEERRAAYQKFLDEKPLRMQNLKARFRVSQEVQAIAREAASKDAPQEQPVALLEERGVEVLAMAPVRQRGILRRVAESLKELF